MHFFKKNLINLSVTISWIRINIFSLIIKTKNKNKMIIYIKLNFGF